MLTRDLVKTVNESVGLFIGSMFPGLFLLDSVFDKGLFSGGIQNIYEFALLLVWSFVISTPYLIFSYLGVKPNHLVERDPNSDELSWSQKIYGILMPLVIILPTITYCAYTISIYLSENISASILGLPKNRLIFFASFIFTLAIAPWFGKKYAQFVMYCRKAVRPEKK